MTTRMRLDWYGDKVFKTVRHAQESAVAETVDAAVSTAKHSHPWRSRTGAAEAGIERGDLRTHNDGVIGEFGYTVPYGLFLEIGMHGRPGDHTLRRAADLEAKHTADRIRKRLD